MDCDRADPDFSPRMQVKMKTLETIAEECCCKYAKSSNCIYDHVLAALREAAQMEREKCGTEIDRLAREFVSAHLCKEAARSQRRTCLLNCESFARPDHENGDHGTGYCHQTAGMD